MAPNFARRAMEGFQRIGQPFLGFAYEGLPARHDTRVKFALDFVAMQLGLAICCILVLVSVLFCLEMGGKIMGSVEDAYGHSYQVEVTGVDALGFPGQAAQDMMRPSPSPPRFNLTARVVNRKSSTPICLRNWQVDVWHAGTPFGKGYFSNTCLEGTSETVAKASVSNTDLLGLHGGILQHRMEGPRTSPGDLKLQIEMTLNYFKGHDRRAKFDWLWCHATTDMKSPQPPCRIHSLWPLAK